MVFLVAFMAFLVLSCTQPILTQLCVVQPRILELLDEQITGVIHVAFRDRETKRAFYDQLHPIGSGKVCVIDCGYDNIEVDSQLNLGDTENFAALILKLELILAVTLPSDPLFHISIHTLIIDNLSVYYWELKLLLFQDQVSKYQQLGTLLQTIHKRYNCSVITTSWDSMFELGYQYNHKSVPERLILIPTGFFEHFSYVVHYEGEKRTVIKRNKVDRN